MDREIKFRGRRVDSGNWVYGDLVYEDLIRDHLKGMSLKTTNMSTEGEFVCKVFRVDLETVCQYIGLMDKYGREVYEGDLIKFTRDTELIIGIGLPRRAYMEVAFDRACFWGENTDWQEPLHELIGSGEIEVIGNIFEHPEIAEEKL